MYLSVIIPCYNEEKRIGKTLQRIGEYLKVQPYESEVIVVDNGSKDNTNKVIESFKTSIPNLRIVRHRSHGKGWAVKQGMLEATGEYRLFTDADNSTEISQVEKLLPFATQGFDVVISSRRAEGAVITNPQKGLRAFLSDVFAFIVRRIVPLGIKDTQNGFKLFTEKATKKIFPHQTIFYWAFDVEILAIAQKFGFKIKEVPIEWINDEGSSMSIKGAVRMLFEVLITRLHLQTRYYFGVDMPELSEARTENANQ